MPKIIQPKRLNKNISVDQYWDIRNKLKAPKKAQPIQAFRQQEVANRFRYLKPTEQAKLFNPLNYFFKSSVKKTGEEQQYAAHFKDQQSTFTQEFLSSLRYRVSGPLIPIKKFVFGIKSIIYNREAILNTLLNNLELDETWPLIQAVIKDTKEHSFQFWMNQGLKRLAYQKQDQNGKPVSIYLNFFSQIRFQNLFDTLAVFMQANYEKIMQNLKDFFKEMSKYFFNHQNKYIRKFSMKCVSYIINNISLEDNLSLIFNIVLSSSITDKEEQIPIGELLLNRHKAIKGCLSSVEINNVIETMKQLPLFMSKNFADLEMELDQSSNKDKQQKQFNQQLQKQVDNILSVYISGILDLLETKFGRAEQNQAMNEILFDLNYCIRAFVAVQQKSESHIPQLTLIKAFHQYLQNCDQKRFLTHNFKHQAYINETFQLMLGYLQSSTIKVVQTDQAQSLIVASEVSKLLGLCFKICPKQSAKFLLSKGVIHFCKLLEVEDSLTLVENIHGSDIANSLDQSQCKTLGQFLLMTFSRFIKQFFESIETQNNLKRIELLYTVFIILKKINFNNTINLSYLGLDKNLLIRKAESIHEISDFFVFAKLTTLLNLSSQNDAQFQKAFTSCVRKTFQSLIRPFTESLQAIINTQKSESNESSLFSYNNHIQNLLRYSHHEVEWVNIAYNLEECFKFLIRKVSSSNEKDTEKWVWSDLSLNRVIEIDEKQDLNSIFESSLNLLQSRNRMARKSILQRVLILWPENGNSTLKSIIERIHTIDSEDIDLGNQRDVKKEFITLEQQISEVKASDQLSKNVVRLLANWTLGFSFTGFKLINDSIVSFTNTIFDLFSTEVSDIIFAFISYYIYRHSRQFQYDTTQSEVFVLKTPKRVEPQFNAIKEKEQFYSLIKEDFSIQDQITIEWIGLERIGQSIGKSRKFKNNNAEIKKTLEEFLTSYFSEEFFRKINVLSSHKLGQAAPDSHLILQPKTRFLAVMLKLCTNTYLPPYECLHYLSPEYLCLQSVHVVKKNRWEALWVKKLKGSKSKQEISDTVNTTIALDKMVMEEQYLYAHFLWKQVLEGSQQRRRQIFEHIRDRIPDIIPYMLNNILYKQMLFVRETQKFFDEVQSNEHLLVELKEKLSLQNKKTLLNMMYLLKAMVVVFKNFLRNSNHMSNIVIVLRCLIQLVYQKSSLAEKQEEQDIVDEEIEDAQEEEEQEQEQTTEQKDAFTLYKPHRKELYKVLTEVFTHYSLNYDQADSILSDLSLSYLQVNELDSHFKEQKVFAKIAYASVNSVPGILILLKVVSQQSFYHHLLLKFGILDLVSSIVDITQIDNQNEEEKIQEERKDSGRKKQSNPHAVNTCLEILSNILGIYDQKDSSQMENQTQNHIKTPWQKWTQSLSGLLNSINHYFLFSKNLSEKTQHRSAFVELDYYSHENKQNINSMQNNKNRSKKEHNRELNEGRNLDMMWQIIGQIMKLSQGTTHHQNVNQISLGADWEPIFWAQINKIVKVKLFKEKQYIKLFKIIEISLIYFNQQLVNTSSFSQKVNIQEFLCKIISVLPHINQLSERVKLTTIIHKGIVANSTLRLLDEEAINTVTSINSIKRNGLNVEIDYDLFFAAISKYCEDNARFKISDEMVDENNKQEDQESRRELNLLSHQYIIYNLLPYLTSEELSVRKAVRQALNSFLVKISLHLKDFESQTLKVFNSILRLLIQQLKKNEIDNVFWSIVGSIGLFIRFGVQFTDKFSLAFENYQLYNSMLAPLVKLDSISEKSLTFESESDDDFFHMIASLSQGNKMKALKMLKERCIILRSENLASTFREQEKGCCLPHPLPFILTTLEHLVMPVKHFQNQHQYNVQGNLTSTLTHISLEIYESIIPFARQSLIKKELKRLSSKIKFHDQHKSNQQNLKRNILLIKIISSIVEGIDTLQKCTGNIKKYVTEYGFDEFHSKLIQNARKMNQQNFQEDQESDDDEEEKKNQFGANLEDLEQQEAIDRNFMNFDRKLMTMQQKEQQQQTHTQQQNTSLINFLKLHILIPLKLMLFHENKSSKQAKQEEDKSRMMISVAITKMLIKFPMEMFLFEFQKILSKICRLLKKRKLQVRQNGRKSLCQIAKIVGPQMLYAIVLELKFHLRDNFQKHIFNFTVFEIIQTLSPLKHGQIDYCLPLILPMIIDEIFGQSSEEKKMVEANEVPVLNMQTKKKKGNELLIMISRQISVDRIRYLIEYLEKFLKEFLNSETNLSKYDIVVNSLMNGLGQNEEFADQQNAPVFGQVLCDSMYELRKQIKIYDFEEEKNKITHQTTIKVNTQKSKKSGKQTLLLQEEVGRNGSIFKKMSKEVYQKRNKEIMINCLVQFYLALGSLLIRKQVISIKTLQNNKHLIENYIKIMQFVFECMDHRDNRIVCKSMRLLHQTLIMNYEKSSSQELKESTKSLRKKVSRKILLFIEKLTSSDAQLLKQSFTILIDLFTHVTITKEFLPSIITIIKLHTNNDSQQANIPEPYRLLKLIIYKLPESIYDSLIYDMYQLVRINVVNCSSSEIRDVCRSIAMTYVRSKEFLLTGLELGSQNTHSDKKDPKHSKLPKSKHQELKDRNVEHEYSQRIKKELNFYLSNLDCKLEENKLLILEIISEFISNRTKQELEEVSELLLLSLSTSLINGNECVDKIHTIMNDILKTIDKSKVYEVLEKALVWVSQPRDKHMIRECGYLLLHVILQSKSIQIDHQTVKSQYLLKQGTETNNLLNSISTLLDEELTILTDHLLAKRQANSNKKLTDTNNQWNSVLDAIDVEDANPYMNENKILEYCIDVLTSLSQSTTYQQKLKDKNLVYKVWRLLKIPKVTICEKSIRFLEHVKNLTVHLSSEAEKSHDHHHIKRKEEEQQANSNDKQLTAFKLKSAIATLINNEVPKERIHDLLAKFHSEEPSSISDVSYLQSSDLLLSFMNKLVMKFKFMESKAQTIYYLLNHSIIEDKNKRELIFKNEELQNKLIDALGKVSRNEFVTLEVKTLNEVSMNTVKQIVGVSDFFKKLTKLQSERRQKKSEQKANLARLAITDQKAYIQAKKKKVKTENL